MELLAANWTNETTGGTYDQSVHNCITPYHPIDIYPWLQPIVLPQITTITQTVSVPSFTDVQVVQLLTELRSGKSIRSWVPAIANLLITLKLAEVCEWTDESPTQRRAVAIKATALGKTVANALAKS